MKTEETIVWYMFCAMWLAMPLWFLWLGRQDAKVWKRIRELRCRERAPATKAWWV